MATPFVYPKARHVRSERPRQFKNYRTYKAYLRREFRGKCVYCRKPDSLGAKASFSVDHYRPKRRFPDERNRYANLYYACNSCNSRKGGFWPTVRQTRSKLFIPNPCEHVMFEHVRFSGERVLSRSKAGEMTVELLDLNCTDAIGFRKTINISIALHSSELSRVAEAIGRANDLLKSATQPREQAKFTNILAELAKKVDELNESIRRLLGST